MWTLANHPRVPEQIRSEVARWGMCKDEFVEGNGWPEQLYIREARRMIGEYVMTQHNCQGREVAEDAVGLAAYTMDSHNVAALCGRPGPGAQRGRRAGGRFPTLSDQLPRARAQGPRVRQPVGARLPFGLAYRLRLDPHGAGLHGARPVGGNGRLSGHRRWADRPIRRLSETPPAACSTTSRCSKVNPERLSGKAGNER